MTEVIADKLSFISKLSLLSKATSDDGEPTAGYMYLEISNISFESGQYCDDLVCWLIGRLGKKSCHVKLKVLRIMKYLITNGHPQFRQTLRKNSQCIADATKHSGPPDPLHGNAPYLAVRQEAKELSRSLFTVLDEEQDVMATGTQSARQTSTGLGSLGSQGMQGFGNTVGTTNKSIGDSILGGIQDLAEKAANMVLFPEGRSDVTFAVPAPHGNFPSYKPVTVPDVYPAAGALMRPDPVRKLPAKHKRGVAGGGWEDSDNEDLVDREVISEQKESTSHSVSSSGSFDRNIDASKLEDWSAESQLLSSFVGVKDKPLATRDELRQFVSNCSSVSCGKVIELLNGAMDASSTTAAMRSLLALESLLRTDLVSPDHIATTCCQHLTNLYTSECVNNAVRQKARKIIRILEKLAPKQAHLFSGISAAANCDRTSEICAGNVDKTEYLASDNVGVLSTVFPFLNKSKVSV